MSGSATFTIVTSSRSMNVPRQTATSVHQRFSTTGGRPAWEAGRSCSRVGGLLEVLCSIGLDMTCLSDGRYLLNGISRRAARRVRARRSSAGTRPG